jgi:hypothetical protein
MGELFSIKDLQERFSLKRTAMYKLRLNPTFPAAVTPISCHPRYRKSDVERWEEQNKTLYT